MEKNESIHMQIRRQREDSNLSQLEASVKLGNKSNVFYRFENGRTVPTLNILQQMSDVFGWEFNFKIN